ncbi:hypothetical protein LCGC14_1172460 [marine sediment metagenome]|uniref:HTH asnC-type domain-containing protein n=1 Tax=marine sediment metagenome TaxID=412755 RepID=A0A0F9PUZ8_9ZZZZ
MAEGYHRLCEQLMKERDNQIILLVKAGVRHKSIACQVGMQPAGIEARLHKLREEGKLPVAGGSNG